MKRRPVRWARALRAVALAVALLLAVLFVGGNFVLVEVRLLGLDFETRLAWVGLAAGAIGFALGQLRPTASADRRREPGAGADGG